ncbi:MAG: DUF4198 domain-containing protein [Gemmatimonadetes bacterium]|nr:DUF4198 domain-containing protein [Gemmatimonadota bacterium]
MAIARVGAKQGEYGAYEYGTSYFRDENGTPFFRYTTPTGNEYGFSVPAWRAFLAEIKKPATGVIPTKFKVTASGNAPWFDRPEVNREALDARAAYWADRAGGTGEGASTLAAAAQAEGSADGGGSGTPSGAAGTARAMTFTADRRYGKRPGTQPGRRTAVRVAAMVVALLVTVTAGAAAHDLFMRSRAWFVSPGASVRVNVLNGTFSKSESPLTFDRLTDLRIVGPGGTTRPDTTAWRVHGDSTDLVWTAGVAGTYVVGAAVAPRDNPKPADVFNAYLKAEGNPDELELRRKNGELTKAVRERYGKNVKALVQVGEARTAEFATELGHSAELVPQENPYSLRAGAELRIRVLVDGKPVANQVVLFGGVGTDGKTIAELAVRSGTDGVATITPGKPGSWYAKFISLKRVTDDPAIDYQSKWATLAFGVR